MKKGFTLIELLAVIVILAIIALIATPIILGIINDAKEDSNKRSVENYAHAVELAVARAATKQGGVIEPGIYTISNEGKTITSESGNLIEIDYKGEAITNGSINVSSDGKIELIGISFDEKTAYNYSESNGVTSGEIKEEVKEITHVILPDGTLVYYKGKGDVKVPATLDGVPVKALDNYAFSKTNIIYLEYPTNPEACSINSADCVSKTDVILLDASLEEPVRNYLNDNTDLRTDSFELIVPKTSSEIVERYTGISNELSKYDEDVDAEVGYVTLKNNVIIEETVYETEITSVDLSGATSLTEIYDWPFRKMQNLKTIILPSSLNSVYILLEDCPSMENIIVPFKEGQLPGYWDYIWNKDGDRVINVTYTG